MTLLNKIIKRAITKHIVKMDAVDLYELILRWYAQGDNSRCVLICLIDARYAKGCIAGDNEKLIQTLSVKASENMHLRILLSEILSEVGRNVTLSNKSQTDSPSEYLKATDEERTATVTSNDKD